MNTKEMWFQAFEREISELESEGWHPKIAYQMASDHAFAKAQAAFADRVDDYCQQKKDDGI